MKINAWGCICPQCRHAFVAYLASNYAPPHDEVAHDQRSLLCNVCERAFMNALYRRVAAEVLKNGQLPLELLHLSALQQEAQHAGEPGQEAQVGTVEALGVPGHVQGVRDVDRNASMEDRVSGPNESADETQRGPTAFPAQQPE